MNDSDITKIRTQIAEFEARRTAAGEVCRQIGIQISEILAAPPTREECIAAFDAELTRQADLMRSQQLDHWFASWRGADPAYRDKQIGEHFWWSIRDSDWPHTILPLLMPLLRAQVTAAIENAPWPDSALTPTQREQRLADLQPKYERATADLDALNTQAEKLGLR